MSSNGFLVEKYSDEGDETRLFEGYWKTGDTLIVKRDEQNDIYFGINDENDLKNSHMKMR